MCMVIAVSIFQLTFYSTLHVQGMCGVWLGFMSLSLYVTCWYFTEMSEPIVKHSVLDGIAQGVKFNLTPKILMKFQ